MRWACGEDEVELLDEWFYSPTSADNPRRYDKTVAIVDDPIVGIGVRIIRNDSPSASAIVTADGTGAVHERSCVVFADRCLIAVGRWLVALSIPTLDLLWCFRADDGLCFALIETPDCQHVVVHGEMSISLFTLAGDRVWECGGEDIFTGTCKIRGDVVSVSDFNGKQYAFDLATGRDRNTK